MAVINRIRKYYRNEAGKGSITLLQEDIDQIILIRHGEPDVPLLSGYKKEDILEHDEHYLKSSVKPINIRPLNTNFIRSPKIYHSSIRRAAHTAEILFQDSFTIVGDARFREFERGVVTFFGLLLPLKFWTTICRLLWFIGVSSGEVESVRKAKRRARENAEFLASEAMAHRTIILVAHGWHNRYVAKYLKKSGWSKVYDNGHGYLGMKILARI